MGVIMLSSIIYVTFPTGSKMRVSQTQRFSPHASVHAEPENPLALLPKRLFQIVLPYTTALITTDHLGSLVEWNLEFSATLTAPEGQLDSALPTLMAIAMSVREVPNWSRLKAQHLAKMQQIKIEGAVAVHQIRMGAIAGKLKARKQRQAGSSLTRRVSNYAPPTLAHVCHLTLIPF